MATTKVTAQYKKDTAKGKKHFSLDTTHVQGAVYLSPEKFKELGEPEELTITITGA
jgi:hypothetical protein